MSSHFTVVYDACVLYPAPLRDLVEGFESLIASIELPDPDDRHVLAAAIHCGADTIVTFNLKDFPVDVLERYHLSVQHPDDFVVDLLDLYPASVLQAIAEQRASLKHPPMTADALLEVLLKQGLTQTVALLRDWRLAF